VEFSCSSDKVVIYDLEEDGSLIAWDEVPLEAGDLPVALE
jgi:hypothetical protein